MNMQHVVKAAGAIHEVKRVNGSGMFLEIDFYGHKAIFWPKAKSVVLRNPVDGKMMSLKTK